MKLQGRAWKFGSDIDTDARIIPARYLNLVDPIELGKHAMEEERPEFVKQVKPGDILVAGKNFGCGSSREHVPLRRKWRVFRASLPKALPGSFIAMDSIREFPCSNRRKLQKQSRGGGPKSVDLRTGEIEDLSQRKTFRAKPIPSLCKS